MIKATRCQSKIGQLTLAADGENLIGLWMEGQRHFGGGMAAEFVRDDAPPLFRAARKWLDSYFNGGRPAIADLPLAPRGSGFRQAVWDLLREIPYGEYQTYGEIAERMAVLTKKPGMSARAVGGAVGHNPIAIIIPCHRVVGANGNLTGYAGGIDRKISLLRHEGADIFPCTKNIRSPHDA